VKLSEELEQLRRQLWEREKELELYKDMLQELQEEIDMKESNYVD